VSTRSLRSPKPRLIGGVEAGGSKFLCAISTAAGKRVATSGRITASNPAKTVEEVVAFFAEHAPDGLDALGIASFGPVELDPASDQWGYITNTPKRLWVNFPLAPTLSQRLKCPVAIQTDVNAAALGEYRHGAGKGAHTLVYVTVGTGIGGGVLVKGKFPFAHRHPELGHMQISRLDHNDSWPGACKYHRDCLEGLASAAAIRARWDRDGSEIPPKDPAWNYVAHYLACGVVNIALTLSPDRILLGGGVLQSPGLLEKVQAGAQRLLRRYVPMPELLAPRFEDSGLVGALALASDSLKDGRKPSS
jgi:fructokinase